MLPLLSVCMQNGVWPEGKQLTIARLLQTPLHALQFLWWKSFVYAQITYAHTSLAMQLFTRTLWSSSEHPSAASDLYAKTIVSQCILTPQGSLAVRPVTSSFPTHFSTWPNKVHFVRTSSLYIIMEGLLTISNTYVIIGQPISNTYFECSATYLYSFLPIIYTCTIHCFGFPTAVTNANYVNMLLIWSRPNTV